MMSSSLFGTIDAHYFELLSNIADWLFANKINDAFKLPKVTIDDPRQQRLQ